MKRTSSFTFISHRQRHNDIICLVREEGRGQGMNGGYLASRARPFKHGRAFPSTGAFLWNSFVEILKYPSSFSSSSSSSSSSSLFSSYTVR